MSRDENSLHLRVVLLLFCPLNLLLLLIKCIIFVFWREGGLPCAITSFPAKINPLRHVGVGTKVTS